jgi:hypothetical protein
VNLPIISPEQLPDDVRGRLHSGELIHHFTFIDVKKGGCGSTSAAKQWLLVTDQRILFEANVREGAGTTAKYVHQSGSIPMPKVSYVGVATENVQQGCSATPVTHLRVNSSGGEIILAIPTKEEAARIQGVVDSILTKGE